MTQSIYEEVVFNLAELFQPAMSYDKKDVADFLREKFGPLLAAGVTLAPIVDGMKFKNALLTKEEREAARLLLDAKDRIQ